jgi:serine/threonine protein kinase
VNSFGGDAGCQKSRNNLSQNNLSQKKHTSPFSQRLMSLSAIPERVRSDLQQTPYRASRLIGAGAFSEVYAADLERAGGAVAIKRITGVFDDMATARRVWRETRLLFAFSHSNVVPLLRIIVGGPNRETFGDVYLVMPLAQTDLARIIHSSTVVLTEDHIRSFVYQICRALKYVHSAGVIHRDIKPQNVLVNANCDVLLSDFGSGRARAQLGMTQLTHTTTLFYVAPEGLDCETTSYTSAVDMWSVGCVFAELIERRPLFCAHDDETMLACIRATFGDGNNDAASRIATLHARLPRASESALDMLSRLLAWQASARMTACEALSHAYVHAMADANDEPVCAQQAHESTDRPRTLDAVRRRLLALSERLARGTPAAASVSLSSSTSMTSLSLSLSSSELSSSSGAIDAQ